MSDGAIMNNFPIDFFYKEKIFPEDYDYELKKQNVLGFVL